MGTWTSFQWLKKCLLYLPSDLESALTVLESTRHCRGVGSSIVGVSSNIVALKTYLLDFSVGVGSRFFEIRLEHCYSFALILFFLWESSPQFLESALKCTKRAKIISKC